MPPLNPYESPRELNDARRSALRPFYPKYGMQRLLVMFPLFFGLAAVFTGSGRELREKYTYTALSSGRPINYFEPPYLNEVAWAVAGTLSFILVVAGVTRFSLTHKHGPPCSPVERWLSSAAVVVSFAPLLLGLFLGFESAGRAKAFILTSGMASISALFQFWYWFNYRQAALAVFWVLRSCDSRWIIRQLFYRRPGRP